jgi:hypothetical protein
MARLYTRHSGLPATAEWIKPAGYEFCSSYDGGTVITAVIAAVITAVIAAVVAADYSA